MPELHDPTREALAEVVRDLVKRYGGPSAVATKVGADRTSVHRWMNGNVPLDKIGVLAEKLEEPIVLTFGPKIEETPPAEADGAMSALIERWDSDVAPNWAQGLATEIIDAVKLLRGEALEQAANQAARASARALGLQIPDEQEPETVDQPPGASEPPTKPPR